ncbi:MAG: hypothetical protein ACE5GW_03995 [Planctomycetota bacterium]
MLPSRPKPHPLRYVPIALPPPLLCLLLLLGSIGLASPVRGQGGAEFIRCDVNGNGAVDVGDLPIYLGFFDQGSMTPLDCGGAMNLDAADANDNEYVTIADLVLFLADLFAPACAPPIPPPESCDTDPTPDPGLFPTVEPGYAINATVLPDGLQVEVPIRVSSPSAVIALGVAVELGPELTPGSPLFTLDPAIDAQGVFSQVHGQRVILYVHAFPCGSLLSAGDDQLLGTLHLDQVAGTCPSLTLLPEFTPDLIPHMTTVVDAGYQDHAPALSVEDPPCFTRGDVDGNGMVDLGDQLHLIDFITGLGPGDFVDCLGLANPDSADINDNEHFTFADVLMLLEALICGQPIPTPNDCGSDPTGPGLFPAEEPSYRVKGTVIPSGLNVDIPVLIDTPAAVQALSIALDFGPDLTPGDPAFVLNPLIDGDATVIIDGTTLALIVQKSSGCGGDLLDAGDNQPLGSFFFDASSPGVCPDVAWLPEVTLSWGFTHFATLVDTGYDDHHPSHELETPCGSSISLIRADANVDGHVDIADPVLTLSHLFNGEPVDCELAVDSNDDGLKNIADVIYTLEFLFNGGDPPPPPFPGCGQDPTFSPLLSCDSFDICN